MYAFCIICCTILKCTTLKNALHNITCANSNALLLSVINCSYQGDRQVNTVVTFSCATGYQIDGRSSLRCQENGQWDGQAPVCRSKAGP